MTSIEKMKQAMTRPALIVGRTKNCRKGKKMAYHTHGLVVNCIYRVIVIERLTADLTQWLSTGSDFVPSGNNWQYLETYFGCNNVVGSAVNL